MSTAKTKNESLTPLMNQYYKIKENYPDAILFFRLGDFYEMFGEDALKASPILEIVLTKRQNVPMCGVPYHSVSGYLSKLIKKGYKVAICEQIEDLGQAKGPAQGRQGHAQGRQGIVKREVIRVITPGTLLEENLLDTKKNNYLLSIYQGNNSYGISFIDISTGEFFITELNSLQEISIELSRISPGELILPKSAKNTSFLNFINSIKENYTPVNFIEDWYFEYNNAYQKLIKKFNVISLKSFGIEKNTSAICSAGAILKYLEETQKQNLFPLRPPKFYSIEEFLIIDETAVRNLELVENITTGTRENSLLEILDKTSTAMGSRLLRKNLLQPLTNVEKIKERQEIIEFLIEEGTLQRQISEILKNISDLERIVSRISANLATPRDIVTLKNTLINVRKLKSLLEQKTQIIDIKPKILKEIIKNLKEIPEVIELIQKTIVENPPADISKGGVICDGYNPELDELRKIAYSGKSFLIELEQKERQRTGINSLKIGYTSVFGYYIEVTKPNLHLVPENYIRKQTLVNSERFITPELKEYEEKVLTAEEKILRIEHSIFDEVKSNILKYSQDIYLTASSIAELDFYISLSKIAIENNYSKPEISNDSIIEIKNGRHPVVEKKLIGKTFVPNDTLLDGKDNQIIILTGPNMSGKSTYLRQVALITIMAQVGSFVPAEYAKIGIVDKIFTRIGSADNLAGGESTFMVEMRETANILHNATQRSLLILDEIGRGTSTFDGISIAWATIEYLNRMRDKENIGPKVLFATHYFELTELEEKLKGVKNYNVSVKEFQGEVIFTHKIISGSSDRSYGIHVAKLAGLPGAVIERAKNVLAELEKKSKIEIKTENIPYQLDFSNLTYHPIQEELSKIDINNLTPLEALKILSELKERYGNDK
ncbi:MAG: DNA mismatch repair protein MutS [Endomicrobiia bacterium]